MGDGRYRPYLVVGRIGERERNGAHQRAVAVIALPRAAAPAIERDRRGYPYIEQAVDGIGALVSPGPETRQDIVRFHAPQLAVGIAERQRRPTTFPRACRGFRAPSCPCTQSYHAP